MNINWKRKLTSRKLWIAVAGFAAGLIVIFGGSQESADRVSGAILSGAAVVGYILGEGLTDAAHVGADISQNSGADGASQSGLRAGEVIEKKKGGDNDE